MPGVQRRVAVLGHPLGVGDGLSRTLGVGEARDDRLAADDQAAVGGIDHVGQPGDGVDQVDGMAERLVRLTQDLPLPVARSASTGVEVSIQGLIAYSTVKNAGEVMA